MRWTRIALALALLFVWTRAQADILNSPPHVHGPAPRCTWPAAGCTATVQHQHRTAHDPAAGVLGHGGIDPYVATKSWQNNRTLHSIFTGHPIFAHGHVDPENAIRFDVHSPVAAGDVSPAEKALWDANVPAMAASVFAKWTIAGSLSGAANWATDDDHVAGTGIPWHSSLTFVPVTSGAHEIHVVFGESGAGTAGTFDSTTQTLTIDDDQNWYWLVNTNPAVAPTLTDLYSVLLHEAGHASAFGHFGTLAQGSVMNAQAQPKRSEIGGILHDVDASATHGALDVYAIPDEPAAIPGVEGMGLVLLGGLVLAVSAAAWRRQRVSQ